MCVHVGRFPPQVYEGHTFLLEQYHKAFLQQQVKSPDVSLSVVAFHDLLRCKYIVVVICCHFQRVWKKYWLISSSCDRRPGGRCRDRRS